MGSKDVADLVVVGAGTVGGWASWFARRNGAKRVVVLESDLAGQGASSRAAGVVRAQGGTPETVALGRWTIEFYRRQHDLFGTDSGFRELGYLILAVTKRDERDGRARVAMQQEQGLDVRWVSPEEAVALNPTLALEGHRAARTRRPTARSTHRGTCAPTGSRCAARTWTCASAPRSSATAGRRRAGSSGSRAPAGSCGPSASC